MMGFIRLVTLAMVVAVMWPGIAFSQARDAHTFAVLPFAVHGPEDLQYLSSGIQAMFMNRLRQPGSVEPLDKAKVTSLVSGPPESEAAARSIRKELEVEYLVWGSATILGQDASLDVYVAGPEGKVWPKSFAAPIKDMIPSLQEVAASINAEIIEAPEPAVSGGQDDVQEQSMGSAITVTSSREEDKNVTRTQALDFASAGMVVDDLDGDGSVEIALVEDGALHVFAYRAPKVMRLASLDLPPRRTVLNLRTIDTDRDGVVEIIVSAMDGENPEGYIFNYSERELSQVQDRLPYFLNVVRMPPAYTKVLVGMRKGRVDPIYSDVHQMVRMDGEWRPGTRIRLPEFSNVFNFGFMPHEDSYVVLIADRFGKLKIYDADRKHLLEETMEDYLNSSVGVEYYEDSLITTKKLERDEVKGVYYIPMRMLLNPRPGAQDFDMIVGRNISNLGTRVLQRYRDFSESEVLSVYLGVEGLQTEWKSRRIGGALVDYQVADIDDDPAVELLVNVNRFNGFAGVGDTSNHILIYDLYLPDDK
jgi:TolB-like protein